jgi:hypothetical protein
MAAHWPYVPNQLIQATLLAALKGSAAQSWLAPPARFPPPWSVEELKLTTQHNAAPIRWGGSVQQADRRLNYAFFKFSLGFNTPDSWPIK